MTDLFDLVDDHTGYFKSHLDALPPQERRVYLALAKLWIPATTREIAAEARLNTNACSAQLARLGERGVVQVIGGSARRKQYYLTERLYNIYYLLRRHREPDRLVEALIHFMESFYSPDELREIAEYECARPVDVIDSLMWPLYESTLAQLLESPVLAPYRENLAALKPERRRESRLQRAIRARLIEDSLRFAHRGGASRMRWQPLTMQRVALEPVTVTTLR